MNTTKFSEFTFGYALTHSIEWRLPTISSVPSFPSLYEEGGFGGGYDVAIEQPIAPLFLQFKIPRVIKRRSRRSAEMTLPPTDQLVPPYYRMYLHPRGNSDQQKLLLEHANSGREVYYATPEFHDKGTIDACHRAHTVQEATAFFSPADIGPLADNNEHYIAYEANRTNGWFCSVPKSVPNHGFRKIQAFVNRSEGHECNQGLYAQLIEEYAATVRSQARFDLLNLITASNTFTGPLALAHRASYLAELIFDCQLLITHPPREGRKHS